MYRRKRGRRDQRFDFGNEVANELRGKGTAWAVKKVLS
jgi:hypothetical protein